MIGRDYTPEERARSQVAEQMRRLTHELMRRDQGADALRALADRLRAEADLVESSPERPVDFTRFTESGSWPLPSEGEEFFNSPDRPFSGLGHPFSVPMRVMREGDRAVCDLVLDRGFQGAPGMSHGGFVAGVFDDLLGFLLMLQETIAFTAYLTINYHEGTPIGEPLRFEAWIDRIEGRKLFLAGECFAGEVRASSCEALFIDASAHFDELLNSASE